MNNGQRNVARILDSGFSRRAGAWLAVLLCAASIGCSKLGGGDNSKGNPTSPSNVSAVQGGWAGTLTRPGGQIVALRWEAAPGKVLAEGYDGLVGPMTLTGPSASTTVAASLSSAGNDKLGYTVRLQFDNTTPPAACSVKGASAGQTGDPYPAPYKTITGNFEMFVVGDCRGVFEGGTQQTNLRETVRISLTK